MLLSELFNGAPAIEINQLSVDSRLPMKDAIFFCLNGIKYDGHSYINEAIENGAKVVVYSKDIIHKDNAIFIKVPSVNNALIKVAQQFYNDPNKDIDTYIVSGNYGKSCVSTFINYFLNNVSSCGSVGILGINYGNLHLKSLFSTLNILENIKILDSMRAQNIKSCTFEAGVRSLNLQKLDCIYPDFFIYTFTDRNASEYFSDDYYIQLRKYLYTLEKDCHVILNIDDESFDQIYDCVEEYTTYGTDMDADYRISDMGISAKGIKFKLIHDKNEYEIVSSLQGVANIYNLTAAITALHLKGYDFNKLIDVFKNIDDVDGVMERIDNEYNIIVDSAYDIGSIEQICKYADMIKKEGKAIGVVPINYSDGENRIEQIIKICEEYLDVIILTENESSEDEVMHILNRCNKYSTTNKIIHCSMRSIAIENAIEIMNKNDVLIIIGKGNEDFLEMGLGKEYYRTDKYYAKKYIEKRRREENEII